MKTIDEILKEHNLIPRFIINGEQGPTGKTYLCDELRANGYDADEEWLLPDDESKKQSNGNSCTITITLNERITGY